MASVWLCPLKRSIKHKGRLSRQVTTPVLTSFDLRIPVLSNALIWFVYLGQVIVALQSSPWSNLCACVCEVLCVRVFYTVSALVRMCFRAFACVCVCVCVCMCV